jgi:hypothetical protein
MGIADRKAEALEGSPPSKPDVTFAASPDVTLGPADDLFAGAR